MAPLRTFHTSPHKGSAVKGQELNDCYLGASSNDGLRNGQGTYSYANGFFTYEGQYVQGEKHGHGTLTSKDGSSYVGDFTHDEITGSGTKRFANGNVYTGTFIKGDLYGHGTLKTASGDAYEGEFAANCYHGTGSYRFRNGDAYEGNFCKQAISGQGIMQYASGDRYEGNWAAGKRSGAGSCTFKTGNTYEGAWRDDDFNGEGSLWAFGQQVTYRGLFVDGLPTTIPRKLNALWYMEQLDPRAAKGAAVARKGPGKDDGAPLLQVVLGTPITVAIVLAAQYEVPHLETPVAPVAPKSAAVKVTAPAVPPAPILMITEHAPAGQAWATASMEFGRLACLTLHPGPPQPLPADKAVTVVIAPAMDADGGMCVLLVLLQVHVDLPLPLGRSPDGLETLYGVRMELEAGQASPPTLCLGADPADLERLSVHGGIGALVASSWGLQPGYMRVTLPEPSTRPTKVKAPKEGKESRKEGTPPA